MALKDWKKITSNTWKKESTVIGVRYSSFANKYFLIERDSFGIERHRSKGVSKSQALKFAKSYMRKH